MIKTQNGKQTSATAVKVSSPILYVCAQNFAKTTSKYTDRQQKVTAFTVVFTLIKKNETIPNGKAHVALVHTCLIRITRHFIGLLCDI
jgi:hypothetical protein